MANSKYEYVKDYELDDRLLPGCWIVVRLDGRAFTRFSQLHSFEKPNDPRALALMDQAAKEVLREFGEIRLAFGESDEYSFVFYKHTNLYGRRASKLVSLVTSCFTGSYVRYWQQHFPDTPMQLTPLFDGRAGTQTDFKNELLFTQFGINYNKLPEQYRKGSVVIRKKLKKLIEKEGGSAREKEVTEPVVLHCDIIRNTFWQDHPALLS
ncbi:hypothetical protein N2152v2_004797 [Parachlorella kessleri]